MKPTPLLILIAGLAAASSVEAKWQRFPSVDKRPVEAGIKGINSSATIDSSNGIGRVNALLSADVVDHADIGAGNSNAVINLGKAIMVSRSTFTNDEIEGRATLSGSADKKSWAVLDEKVFTSSDREVAFTFAGMQVKFVKIEFALSKGGSIRNFQMFGAENDGDYTVKQSADGKSGSPVNFAGVGGARIIYASPKPSNSVDSAAAFNKFSFPESDERYRTIIYDMGQLRIMNEFGSVHSPRPVRFEVFAFDQLPEKEDWRGRLAFDPAEFNVKEPVASAEDTRGLGYIKAKPAKSVKSRYIAMRWEPDFNPPAFEVGGINIGGFGNFSYTPGAGGPGAGAGPGDGGTPPPGGPPSDPGPDDAGPPPAPIQGAQSLNGVGLNAGANSP
ncbi:MAG: hypothetical protein HS117_00340 [Verrucomicrobiaceae bacterium]|nr:hypothetical protein [Verrucomicrobiaceae bacterium]